MRDPLRPSGEVDMSERAVDGRLTAMGQLYRLGQSLKAARWLGASTARGSEREARTESEAPRTGHRSDR